MTIRPCLDCGAPATGPRCPAHTQARRRSRPTAAQRGYGSAWRRVRRAVLERDGWTCRYCGAPATTVDHVVARVVGGSMLDESNLVASCEPCNTTKSATDVRDFLRRIEAKQ